MAGHRKAKGKPLKGPRKLQLDPSIAATIGSGTHVAYTDAEVRARLIALRDGCLDWALDAMRDRDVEPIGVALHAVNRANSELDRMDERERGGTLAITINGWDPSRLVFGSNTIRNTATE